MKSAHRVDPIALAAVVAVGAFFGLSGSAHAARATRSFDVSVNAHPAAVVTLSASNFYWANIASQDRVPSDNGPVAVTGTMRTSANGGGGSIGVMSPNNLTGTQQANHTLNISQFSLGCSGSGNVGTQPTYAPLYTVLAAQSTVPCATWGQGATSHLNFLFNLFLDGRGLPSDTYASNGFALIASST
ncbi:MAG: hypothetical protein ACR2KS_04115 [Candidatus Eremiobacter antarcticus]|nr:hypothetical protein [Candidatus Eremiobacteraeota bacterium]MBC5808875.1 hypothetical protein [Candidatus Eremiobacteraeota bacterium]